MSDGPHRSLNMRPAWKRLAEVADNRNYTTEDVCERYPEALASDWRSEVPDSIIKGARDIVAESQESLFGDQRPAKIEALQSDAAGFPLAGVLLDCINDALSSGLTGTDALVEGTNKALQDRAARSVRQVEEHYNRESNARRAEHVRERFEGAVVQTDLKGLAEKLVGPGNGISIPKAQKRKGIEDGVPL